MADKVFRVEIEGHLVEVRRGDLGGEECLVDGRSVSRRLFGGWIGGSHHVDVIGSGGRSRHLDVRVTDASAFGLGRYVVVVSVDGVPRARVRPVDRPTEPVRGCLHCGYVLLHLVAERGEIRCPECGRHTPEAFVGSSAAPVDGWRSLAAGDAPDTQDVPESDEAEALDRIRPS